MYSKLICTLLCAILPVVLTTRVCAEGSEPLKASIEHSETMQPAPTELRQGATFDEAAMPKLDSLNNWTPVPNWLAGTWQFKTETVTHMRTFEKTHGEYPNVPFVLHNEFQKTIGYQRDKSGQVWDYIKAPYSYTTKLDRGLKGYERITSVDIIKSANDEHIRRVCGPDSVIDPSSQQILLTNQKECFNRYSQMGDDAVRLDGSSKVFDMQGNPQVLKISNLLAVRAKPFEVIDQKDGENLKQLFADYLNAHGKADLVP